GEVAAGGGSGEFSGGGGGGGGRIAIYSPINVFTGQVSVAGGLGAVAGSAGTIFTSTSLPGFQIISQAPAGEVSNTVSQLTLEFSAAVNPLSASVNDLA